MRRLTKSPSNLCPQMSVHVRSHTTHKDFNIVHICQLTSVFETVNMSEVETFVEELKEDGDEVENRKKEEEFKKQNVTVTRTVSKEGIKVKLQICGFI